MLQSMLSEDCVLSRRKLKICGVGEWVSMVSTRQISANVTNDFFGWLEI